MMNKLSALTAELAASIEPRQRIDLMNALAKELKQTSLPRAIAMCEAASELSAQGIFQDQPYHKGLADSLSVLGPLYTQLGNYDLSLSFLLRAMEMIKALGNTPERATVLTVIGATYQQLGDYPDALDFFEQKLELAKILEDRQMEAQAYNAIGHLYLITHENTKALSYLLEGLNIFEDLLDHRGQAEALTNLSLLHSRLGDHDKALVTALNSRRLYQEIGDPKGEAESLKLISDVYQVQHKNDLAMEQLQQALEIAQTLGLSRLTTQILLSMGNIYNRHNYYDLARAYMHQALEAAQALKSKPLVSQCHQALAQAYKRELDFEAALAHFEQFQALREATHNEEMDKSLKSLEIAYRVETARKEAEIARLKGLNLQQEIAERQQTEEALRTTNQQLQKVIAAREQLISDLDAFARMVAHDLKNPLNTINLSSAWLWHNYQDTADPQTKEFLQAVVQTAARMERIINELLILASVRQQEITLRPLKMGSVVKEVTDSLAFMIQEYQAEIVLPNRWPVALGHTGWVEEIWTNYITNAIKYGGRPPRIELGAEPLKNGKIKFWVRDNGDGIHPDAQVKLFKEFSRLDRARAKGYGLGLAIVKRIVQKLGGEVSIESSGEPGQGSIFGFTLPRGEA
jgi:signal transduction histidine kinase